MILLASDRLRASAVAIESKLDEEGRLIRGLIPPWLAEFLGTGSVIILPQDEFDSLPDEVRAEMEVLKR